MDLLPEHYVVLDRRIRQIVAEMLAPPNSVLPKLPPVAPPAFGDLLVSHFNLKTGTRKLKKDHTWVGDDEGRESMVLKTTILAAPPQVPTPEFRSFLDSHFAFTTGRRPLKPGHVWQGTKDGMEAMAKLPDPIPGPIGPPGPPGAEGPTGPAGPSCDGGHTQTSKSFHSWLDPHFNPVTGLRRLKDGHIWRGNEFNAEAMVEFDPEDVKKLYKLVLDLDLKLEININFSKGLDVKIKTINKEIKNINNDLKDLDKEVRKLKVAMRGAETVFSFLGAIAVVGGVAGIMKAISAISATVAALQSQIAALQAQVAGIQTQVGTIQAQVTATNTQLNALRFEYLITKGRVEIIQGQVAALQGTATLLLNQQAVTTTALATVTTSVTALSVEIPLMQAQIFALQAQMAATITSGAAVAATVAALVTSLAAVIASTAILTDKINSIPHWIILDGDVSGQLTLGTTSPVMIRSVNPSVIRGFPNNSKLYLDGSGMWSTPDVEEKPEPGPATVELSGDVIGKGETGRPIATEIADGVISNNKIFDVSPNKLQGYPGDAKQVLSGAGWRMLDTLLPPFPVPPTDIAFSGDVTGTGSVGGPPVAITISDGAVNTDKLADSAVHARNIFNTAVTVDKLAEGAVTASKLANDAVHNRSLIDGAVSNSKIISMAPDKLIGFPNDNSIVLSGGGWIKLDTILPMPPEPPTDVSFIGDVKGSGKVGAEAIRLLLENGVVNAPHICPGAVNIKHMRGAPPDDGAGAMVVYRGDGSFGNKLDAFLYLKGMYMCEKPITLPPGEVTPLINSSCIGSDANVLPYGLVPTRGNRRGSFWQGLTMEDEAIARASTVYMDDDRMQFIQNAGEELGKGFIFSTNHLDTESEVAFIDYRGLYHSISALAGKHSVKMLSDCTSVLDRLMKVNAYSFGHKPEARPGGSYTMGDLKNALRSSVGFVADELINTFPSLVSGGSDPIELERDGKACLRSTLGPLVDRIEEAREQIATENQKARASGKLAVNYAGMTVYLTLALQELYKKHTTKVSELEKRISALENSNQSVGIET